MDKKQIVVQCELRNGNGVYVAFIPKQFAQMGKLIRIDDMEGVWKVTQIYTSKYLAEANQDSQDYKHHRKFSDA